MTHGGTLMSSNDREAVRVFYDAYGEREWERLVATPRTRVAYEVHRHFLDSYVSPGNHVLEIGAGPGRFTIDLAQYGATVDVTDISSVQLELHRRFVGATNAESAVLSRKPLDVCDTSMIPENAYDVVVAYGGPLSYAFEELESAFAGLVRITRPGGYIVASVMSRWGTWRWALPAVIEEAREYGEDLNDQILDTGDLRLSGANHICQMFQSRDIEPLVTAAGATLIHMSASNWASLGDEDVLAELEKDPQRWERFIANEIRACAEPGALDGGTHILFAARVPHEASESS